MSEIFINARLPDDSDQEEPELFALAEKLYPSNPVLGLMRLNYLRKLAEEDERVRDEDAWA